MRSNLLLTALGLLALAASSGCCVTVSRSGDCCPDRCSTGLQGRLFGGGLLGARGCNTCGDAHVDSGGWSHDSSGCNSCASTRGGGGLLGGSGAFGSGGAMGGGMGMYSANGGAYDDSGVMQVGYFDGGCGRFGCGMNGRLCLSCRLRGRHAGGLFGRLSPSAQHPYGGHLPHTEPVPGGFGPDATAPTYQYPYYTVRGPRDFLMANPPTIGY